MAPRGTAGKHALAARYPTARRQKRRWGHFVADGYIRSPQRIPGAGTVSLIAPGAAYFRIAIPPYYKPSGSVRAVVNFRYLNASETINHNAISPYLNLP